MQDNERLKLEQKGKKGEFSPTFAKEENILATNTRNNTNPLWDLLLWVAKVITTIKSTQRR